MSSPLVSVVIPTYCRPWGLRRAMTSVLAQTTARLELVVVDDASADDTAAVVRSFDDPRVRYHRQSANVGVANNWGTGVALARGEYLALLMDDDVQGPHFLARRLEAFARDPSLVVVFSSYMRHNREGIPVGTHRPVLPWGHPLAKADFLRASLRRDLFIGASLYRTRCVKNLWPQIAWSGPVVDFTLNLQLALQEGAQALGLEQGDFFLTEHEGQISQTQLHVVHDLGVDVLQDLLRSALPEWARQPIREELASWCLVGGRDAAARGEPIRALKRLLQSASVRPLAAGPWKQLVRLALGSFLTKSSP